MFNGKSIFISGGTGSFGRKFITRLLEQYQPKRVVVFSRDELKQYEMQQTFNAPCMRYFIGDVRDADRLRQAMRGIDYVVHAAALKQVPAAEYNPTECIRTNVNGAENIIAAAIDNGVKKVVALSTDKAASPINLYGATKLLSDKLFVAANNIAGEQQTRARMHGGEVFVPKIPSIRIVDLARGMAEHLPHKNVGIRPGEKLHELMVPLDDARMTLEFEDHYTIQPSIRFTSVDVDFAVDKLGEQGRAVSEDFEYRSDTNPHFLSVGQIADLHAKLSA